MQERVQVAARIRPLLQSDPDDADLLTCALDSTHVSVGDSRIFALDHVFGMEATTTDVYNTVVRPLVEQFLEGYNATVMAYGQTGTGKTYTMSGLMPLVLQHVISSAFGGSTAALTFQLIEVYGDVLRDLLSADPAGSSKQLHVHNGAGGGDGDSYVEGATRLRVGSLQEAMALIHHGSLVRATGTTSIHEHSSRSHSVFTVFNHRNRSKLNLVDLAGSERNKKTNNVGQRFHESIGINGGLLALGNVLRALSRNHFSTSDHPGHVPYRSSKLTRLLQDALGGNSRTVFIACIAPDSYNRVETICTLQYCSLAMKITNKPVVAGAPAHEAQAEKARRQAARHESAASLADDDDGTKPSACTVDDATHKTVSIEEFEALQGLCAAQVQELHETRDELAAAHARVQLCEGELREDKHLFLKQVAELQRLLTQNTALRDELSYLRSTVAERCAAAAGEDAGHSEHGQADAGAARPFALVKDTARHAATSKDDTEAQYTPRDKYAAGPSWVEPQPPSAQHWSTLRGSHRGLSVSDQQTTAQASQHSEELRSALVEPSPMTSLVSEGRGDSPPNADAQLSALTRETLFYQHRNAELRDKLDTMVTLFDTQRREMALMRLELSQAHELLEQHAR